MFERMKISESIYKGVVETSYKKLLGQTPTVLVASDKIEEMPPCHGLARRKVGVLTSAEQDMYTSRRENKNLSNPHPRILFRRM